MTTFVLLALNALALFYVFATLVGFMIQLRRNMIMKLEDIPALFALVYLLAILVALMTKGQAQIYS